MSREEQNRYRRRRNRAGDVYDARNELPYQNPDDFYNPNRTYDQQMGVSEALYRQNERNYAQRQGGGLYGVANRHNRDGDANRNDMDEYGQGHNNTSGGLYGTDEYPGDRYDHGQSPRSNRPGRRRYGPTNNHDGGHPYAHRSQNRYSESAYREQLYRSAGRNKGPRGRGDQSHSAGLT